MKVTKLYLLILLFLLVVQVASADLSLDKFTSDKYNLGDRVLVSGRATYANSTRANLNLVLNCNGTEANIAAILLDLRANQQIGFSKFVVLPHNMVGSCKIVANLKDLNGAVFETAEFQVFELTKDLKGAFETNGNLFQLGDKLVIRGTFTKQNNVPVNGLGIIYFKLNEGVLFLDTFELVNGVVQYEQTLSNVLPGNYSIDIYVVDNFGNNMNFLNSHNFSITGNLNVVPTLDKNLYSPGETLTLTGYVTSSLNREIKNINLEFNFENEIRTRNLATSKDTFSVTHIIPPKVKSGSHNINIIAGDEDGNYINSILAYSVRAIPTTLSVVLDSFNYDPGQDISFRVILLDQAGDPMTDSVNVYLFDVDDNEVYSGLASANLSSAVKLPVGAEPGSWRLKVDALGLEDEQIFTVREYKKLDARLDGEDLVIENVGNVPFKDSLEIRANDLVESKNIKLDTGESSRVSLGKLFPPGSYNVSVPILDKLFEDVVLSGKKSLLGGFGGITSNVARNTESSGRRALLFVALLILAVSVIYLVFGRRKGKDNLKFSQGDFKLGQKKLDELKAKGIRKDRPAEYGKASQEDIDDWKSRVQQTFKDQEKDKSRREFVDFQNKSMQDDKPKGGMFNMFG